MNALKTSVAIAALSLAGAASATVSGGLGGGTGTFLSLSSAGLSGAATATLAGGSVYSASVPGSAKPAGTIFGGTYLSAGPTAGTTATFDVFQPHQRDQLSLGLARYLQPADRHVAAQRPGDVHGRGARHQHDHRQPGLCPVRRLHIDSGRLHHRPDVHEHAGERRFRDRQLQRPRGPGACDRRHVPGRPRCRRLRRAARRRGSES